MIAVTEFSLDSVREKMRAMADELGRKAVPKLVNLHVGQEVRVVR